MDGIIYTDGASKCNPGHSGIGIIIKNAKGEILKKISQYIGEGTNNRAEYMALIEALKAAKKLGLKRIVCLTDSNLVVTQMNEVAKVRAPALIPFNSTAKILAAHFQEIVFEWIPREENTEADDLSVKAISEKLPEGSFAENILKKYNLTKKT